MAAIPGWAYLIIGAAMSIMSKFVESKNTASKFTLFFYVGIIFIVVGVFKIVYKAIFKKEKKPDKYGMQNQGMQAQHHRVRHQNTNQSMSNNPYLQNPKMINPQASMQNTQMHHMQGQHHISNATQNQIARQESSIIPCQSCGTKHYSYANYCMVCGSKIRK